MRTGPFHHAPPPSRLALSLALCLACVATAPLQAQAQPPPADAGAILLRLEPAPAVRSVVAVLTERRGGGVARTEHRGEVLTEAGEGGMGVLLRVAGLTAPGPYDLRVTLEGGGVFEGWDATVPALEPGEDPWPLEAEEVREIARRLGAGFATGFADEARLLAVRGHGAEAAVLMAQLRRRPFVGGGYKPGEWVWRVERWRWTRASGFNWTPDPGSPYYAHHRRRLTEADYGAIAITFSEALGGLRLPDGPGRVLDLGTMTLSRPRPGVHAVDAAGGPIEPIPVPLQR